MIDQFFQVAAEKALSWIHAFLALPNEQKEVICMKILLEVLAILFAVWLGRKAGRAGKRKSGHRPSSVAGKRFKPKKWRTDGSYYDEEKKEWVSPDFK